ncbi:MAG: C40 family peptidase [Nocardioides sp.]|nr:C40 family peptidase [Nocardioides sp.]
MRTPRIAVALALALLVTGPATQDAVAAPDRNPPPAKVDTIPAPAEADPPAPVGAPSAAQVDAAEQAVAGLAGTVTSVRAALAGADQRAQAAAIDAAVAAEAFNGARYEAEQAEQAASAADGAARSAHDAVEGQRQVYADALISTYVMSPSLGALSAIVQADGISTVIENTHSMRNAEDALDAKYDDFRAAARIADASSTSAHRTLATAERATQDAAAASDAAQAAADSATYEVLATAVQRDALIAQLAALQNTSVALARARQSALENAARQATTKAAAAAAVRSGQAPPDVQQTPVVPSPGTTRPPPIPAVPAVPAFPVVPTPGLAPAVSGTGAAAAIAYAPAQIGEPYVWGAAGPAAWDCSGLMMAAWAAGGKYLPHYSVAQYAASTPINPVDLQPGDLLFWGTSASPSSIYHVALYVGGGQMIEAARAGVPVRRVSMFAWIPPTFYTRP